MIGWGDRRYRDQVKIKRMVRQKEKGPGENELAGEIQEIETWRK